MLSRLHVSQFFAKFAQSLPDQGAGLLYSCYEVAIKLRLVAIPVPRICLFWGSLFLNFLPERESFTLASEDRPVGVKNAGGDHLHEIYPALKQFAVCCPVSLCKMHAFPANPAGIGSDEQIPTKRKNARIQLYFVPYASIIIFTILRDWDSMKADHSARRKTVFLWFADPVPCVRLYTGSHHLKRLDTRRHQFADHFHFRIMHRLPAAVVQSVNKPNLKTVPLWFSSAVLPDHPGTGSSCAPGLSDPVLYRL